MKFKAGDTVYYVKESYGEHRIEEVRSNGKVLLSTPKLTGGGRGCFWTELDRIKPIEGEAHR
jgi:hypothetical protein